MKTYSFENLRVWHDSRSFVKWIYQLIELFPNDERFGLANQMRRASISVVSNIAEGTSRKSLREQAHYTQISYSSLLEILNQLIISNDLGLVKREKLEEGRLLIDALSTSLGALRNSQLSRCVSNK